MSKIPPHKGDKLAGMWRVIKNYLSIKNSPPILLVVLFVGFLTRIIFSFSYEFSIIHGISSDDSYYYFRIAQNISNGFGSTFDQIVITNGFQPLIMIPLVIIYWVVPSSNLILPVILGQIFLAIINLAAAIMMYNLVFKMSNGSKYAALFSVLVLFVNPIFIAMNFKSLETNLYWLFLVWILFYFIDNFQKDNFKKDLIFGLLISFAALSRLDGGFLIIAFTVYYFLKKNVKLKEKIKRIFNVGLGFSILFIPYLIYNQIFYGHFVPISGRAKVFHNHRAVLSQVGSYWSFDFLLYEIKRFLFPFNFDLFTNRGFGSLEIILVLVGLVLFLIFVIYLWRTKLIHKVISKFSGMGFLFLFLLFHYSFYTLYFWEYRFYYFLPEILVLVIMFGLFMDEMYQRRSKMISEKNLFKSKFISITSIVIVIIYCFIGYRIFSAMHEQILPLKTSKWINENIKDDSVIGSANTGIISYFSQKKIINLDGMVNNDELINAYKNGEQAYLDYLKKYKVKYICDYFLGDRPENKYYFPKIMNDKYEVQKVVTDSRLKYQKLNHFLVLKLSL